MTTTCSSCLRPTPVVVVLDGTLRLCCRCLGRDLEPRPPRTPTTIPPKRR